MMFSTRALASKNTLLFSAFHEPAYIDKKTSKKIVDALVSSFNRNLDKEYGPLPNSTSRPGEPSRRRSSSPRRQHVDSHLGDILSNPIFSYDRPTAPADKYSLLGVAGPSHHEGAERETRRSNSSIGGSMHPAPQQQSPPKRDPMDVFEEAVSKGLMTIPRATGCLVAKRKMLQDSTPLSRLKAAMGESGAGERVVGWLRSSGAERALSFIDFPDRPTKQDANTLFVDNLIPFLLAEGRGNIVWTWFSRVLHAKEQEINVLSTNASALVISLIRAQWNALSQEHHIPYDMVLETNDRFASAVVDTSQAVQLNVNPVFRAWKYVSFHGTMSRIPVPPPPTPLFDRFMGLARSWGGSVEADMAHLSLHHPTHPNPERAVEYISREKPWRSASKLPSPATAWDRNTVPRLSRVVQMGVDAINYFVRRGDKDEAAHVYSLMTQLFPWIHWAKVVDDQTEMTAYTLPDS